MFGDVKCFFYLPIEMRLHVV